MVFDFDEADTTIKVDDPDVDITFSLAGAGDVNGDGISDITIGIPQYDRQKGVAGMLYGSATFGGESLSFDQADVTLFGRMFSSDHQECHDCAGTSVSGAGDFNGDGYADIIIGAPEDCIGEPYSGGRAYVLPGGPQVIE